MAHTHIGRAKSGEPVFVMLDIFYYNLNNKAILVTLEFLLKSEKYWISVVCPLPVPILSPDSKYLHIQNPPFPPKRLLQAPEPVFWGISGGRFIFWLIMLLIDSQDLKIPQSPQRDSWRPLSLFLGGFRGPVHFLVDHAAH